MYSVEVLLSTYNGEKYIAEQLNSILHQTMPNIHISIHDDGSSDNTVNITIFLRLCSSNKQINAYIVQQRIPSIKQYSAHSCQ